MEKQVVNLLIYSGAMRLTDISQAMRLDQFDTFSIVSRLIDKGVVKSHRSLFTGAEKYSLA